MSKLANIQGALIGGAIGDAVGFLVEKGSIKDVQRFAQGLAQEIFLVKNRTYPRRYEFGQYSDDTQFSKLLILSFLHKISFKDLLIEEYKKNKLVGLGKNTKTLLDLFSKNQEVPFELTQNISNGGVMRSWPVGMLFSCPVEIRQQSYLHSSITHDTLESKESCEFVARVMNLVLAQGEISVEDVIALAPISFKDLLSSALNSSIEDTRKMLIHPSLQDWEGVPPLAIPTAIASVVSFVKTQEEDFKSALVMGLNLGGDTDSVCSVIGALKGAQVSLEGINPFLRGIIQDEGQGQEEFFLSLASDILFFNPHLNLSR